MDCYPGQPTLQQSVEEMRDGSYEVHHETDKGAAAGFDVDIVALKPHSTQAIVSWLEKTYHYEEGICLPRSTIYEHYMDFCSRHQLQPVNAASFGKIIRQQFPSLTTRRLGTRGQSKYHYYGLGIKPSSRYYTEDYVQKQQHQGVTTKKEPEGKKVHAYYVTKEKPPSAVLPKFPDVKNLNLTAADSLPREKLHTFMVMYRTHCQRILDSIVRANFDEVENFLLHFWQGMPPHLVSVLETELVVDLVAVCDMTLYKAISSVFVTTPLQNIPENVAQEVKRFTNNLKFWLELALKGIPDCLKAIKFKVADTFHRNFKRQRSLMHLADAARNAFKGEESLEQLKNDWEGVNLRTVIAQTFYTIQPLNVPQRYLNMIPNFLAEFSCMFTDDKCSVEDFALWIDGVMENCFKDSKMESIKVAGRAFLLTWKFFTSKVVREFTLMSAPSFGTFHLLHMLVDDYIMHTLETMLEKEQEEYHLERINLLRQEDIIEDIHIEDRLSSNEGTLHMNIVSPPSNATPLPLSAQDYTHFSGHGGSRTVSPQEHASPPDTTGMVMGDSRGVVSGGGGRHVTMDTEGGVPSGIECDNRKSNLQTFPAQDPSMIGGLPIQLEPSLQGFTHNTNIMGSKSPLRNAEPYGMALHSQDDSSLQSDQTAGLRLSALTDGSSGGPGGVCGGAGSGISAKSLSHPNLASIPARTLPRVAQTTSNTSVQSQTPIPFPANLGSFTLSSMVGHFASHPQLQPHSLSMNPPGGLVQGLGVSNQSQSQNSNSLTQTLSLPNPTAAAAAAASGLLGSGGPTPIMNPQVSLNTGGGGGGSRPNLPSSSLPMPLTHPITGNLQNPGGLPLIPNMYSYPYTATIPTQPISTSGVRVNTPGFTPQSLVPGYPQYIPPSLYGGNSQLPPVSAANFSR